MCERTYICISIFVYTYIHKNIVPPMILRLLIKYWKIVFLSVTPAFVYLLERGQHEHSRHEAHQKRLKVCLTNNLKVCSLDRALESMLLSDGRFKIEDYTENFTENC